MSLTDDALLKGCQQGRKDCWDAFVERYSKLIYWSLHRTLASSSYSSRTGLIDEIFQEVFAKLLEPGELGRIRDTKAVAKYLIVLSARKALDKMRSLSREERAGDPLDFMAGLPHEPAIEAENDGSGQAVRDTLEELKPKERFCLEMHYLEGKTHREIAGLMGLPQDTVSTLIRRTREKVKVRLTDKGLAE